MKIKNRKERIEKKGISGFEILIIVTMLTVTIVLTGLIPLLFLKTHIVRVVEIQYGYNNAELALLTLLSDRRVYEELSFYAAGMEDNIDEGFRRANLETMVRARLDKLVPSKCYNLSYSNGEILSQKFSEKKCDTEFSVSSYMALPYNEKKEEKITLEMSTERLPKPEITPPVKYCCHNPYTLEVKCETEEKCIGELWEVEYALCSNPLTDCTLE